MNNKQIIADKNLEIIGGEPKVIRYLDANETSSIDIYIANNRPIDGVTAYATIGLSEYSIAQETSDGQPIRVEIVAACGSDYDLFPNVISSCAFNIINDNYSLIPGTIYPNVITPYYTDGDMKHIYFVPPFLWEGFESIELDSNIVTWLMAIPVSNREYQYARRNGTDALGELLQENDIDVFDLSRKSVL